MVEDIIGHVVGVHGFKVRVELASEIKSPVRAYSGGLNIAIAINSYLTFDIGAGQLAVGIVTDLDSRESYEPNDEELTLELAKPRRIAVVQLLGTVYEDRNSNKYQFNPGISILPTLDITAIIAKQQILNALFVDAPKRNRPEDHGAGEDYDTEIRLGNAVAVPGQAVKGSFNDLLSRPLAIVGNTGSGKSYSVSRLIQQAVKDRSARRARIFVIDINGEYTSAFNKPMPEDGRKPNHIYVNGRKFGIPIWLMNTHEVCEWLSAGEQAQQPALVNLWSLSKGETQDESLDTLSNETQAARLVQTMLDLINQDGRKKGKTLVELWETFGGYAAHIDMGESQPVLDSIDSIISTISPIVKNEVV